MNNCKQCSKNFTKTTSNKGYTSFCSDTCYVKNWNSRNKERRKEIDRKAAKKIWRNSRKNFSCCICGFDRTIDFCHIEARRKGGKVNMNNITTLCPNHHRLFDRGLLTLEENAKVKSIAELKFSSTI